MAAKKRMKLASGGKRFWAGCIDVGIMAVLYTVLMVAVAALSRRRYMTYGFGYGFDDDYGFGYNYGYQTPDSGAVIAIVVTGLLMLAYLIVEFVFYAQSKSIGKAIFGLQVVSASDGKPLGFWKMLFREAVVKQASAVLLLGYIWILIDDRNRAWHDKILETYVVDIKESARISAAEREAPPSPAAPAPAPPAAAAAPPAQAAPPDTSAPSAQAPQKVRPARIAPSAAPEADPVTSSGKAPAPQAAADTAAAEAPARPAAPRIRPDKGHAPSDPSEAVTGPDTHPVPEAPAEAVIRADMSMKKAELLEVAKELGISVSSRATKAEIIEAIEKASR